MMARLLLNARRMPIAANDVSRPESGKCRIIILNRR